MEYRPFLWRIQSLHASACARVYRKDIERYAYVCVNESRPIWMWNSIAINLWLSITDNMIALQYRDTFWHLLLFCFPIDKLSCFRRTTTDVIEHSLLTTKQSICDSMARSVTMFIPNVAFMGDHAPLRKEKTTTDTRFVVYVSTLRMEGYFIDWYSNFNPLNA